MRNLVNFSNYKVASLPRSQALYSKWNKWISDKAVRNPLQVIAWTFFTWKVNKRPAGKCENYQCLQSQFKSAAMRIFSDAVYRKTQWRDKCCLIVLTFVGNFTVHKIINVVKLLWQIFTHQNPPPIPLPTPEKRSPSEKNPSFYYLEHKLTTPLSNCNEYISVCLLQHVLGAAY